MTRVGRPLPSGEEKVRAVRAMFDAIAPRYDLLNRIMTFGMDMAWRRRTVAELRLPAGSRVIDVACGTGDFCRELESAGYRAVGSDISAGMLAKARTQSPLLQADALKMPFSSGAADGITCGFALRNVMDIPALFAEFARLLRPGGRVGVLEVAEPEVRLLKAGHNLYFRRMVPAVGGLLSDREAYRYLPESTAYLPSRRELIGIITAAGFTAARSRLVALGAAQIISATRR